MSGITFWFMDLEKNIQQKNINDCWRLLAETKKIFSSRGLKKLKIKESGYYLKPDTEFKI